MLRAVERMRRGESIVFMCRSDQQRRGYMEILGNQEGFESHFSNYSIRHESGGKLTLLLTQDIPDKVRGIEIAGYYIDECTVMSEDEMTLLRSRVRCKRQCSPECRRPR
jgi:hypothetical protein